MPAAVRTRSDENLWSRAKKLAQKQNPRNFHALAMHIYQNMKTGKKSFTFSEKLIKSDLMTFKEERAQLALERFS